MRLREQLLQDVECILEMLASPPAMEVEIGWDEERRRDWTQVFQKLRDAILSGVPLFPEYRHVIFLRGLDMDGICGGAIFDRASHIDAKLREIRKNEGVV